MSTLEIERAIERLPPGEVAQLRAWFAAFDGDRWDGQFEQDAASGKLDALADEALRESRDHPTSSRLRGATDR
ncbi:MAG TPA: hypothetical protein VF624_11875 [Tepidisphaeraceae bacterium]|jgi:hypothetical protein